MPVGFLLFFLPFLAWSSLEETKLVWFEDRQFIIEKGREDGIKAGTFVQVLQNKRYKCRAVSIKVGLTHSLWAMYNAYEPFALNIPVLLKPSGRHFLSESVRETMNLEVPSWREFRRIIRPRIRRVGRRDEKNADLVFIRRLRAKLERKKDIERILYGDLKYFGPNPLEGLLVKMSVSPLMFSNDGAHEVGVAGSLIRESDGANKIEGRFSFERSSFIRQFSGPVVSESRYDAHLFYEYDRWAGHFSPFGFLEYERLREENSYPVKTSINFGPFGIKYYFPTPFHL